MRIRLIYPRKSTCPECASHLWDAAGRKGITAYRKCQKCSATYKVFPAAEEHDDGGLVSVVRPR